MVFSSHLLEQVEEVADRVVILHKGKKMCEGRLEALLEVPEDIQVRIHGVDEAKREQLLALLEREGLARAEVTRPRVTLEEFFIEQVVNKS